MASSSAVLPITGWSHLESDHLVPSKLRTSSRHQLQILFPRRKLSQLNHSRCLSVCAEYKDGSRGGGSDFLAGFLLGGALFGTLAYLFAPQEMLSLGIELDRHFMANRELAVLAPTVDIPAERIRRSLLNEDEYGFQRAKQPIYYDEGLEKTRQTLNAKISQLNAAIDNVSSRLRGGNNAVIEPTEAESEIEAAM